MRKTSRHALKDHPRAKTRRNHGDSLAAIIADLNPMLRGWFGYSKHAYRTEFRVSTASCDADCGLSCVGISTAKAVSATADKTTDVEGMPSSLRMGCSP